MAIRLQDLLQTAPGFWRLAYRGVLHAKYSEYNQQEDLMMEAKSEIGGSCSRDFVCAQTLFRLPTSLLHLHFLNPETKHEKAVAGRFQDVKNIHTG